MAANHIFLSKDNITLLWDVITDEDIFKQCTPDAHLVIHNVFYNNIQSFFDNEKNNTPKLVDMNKKYIMLLLNFINTNILKSSTPKPTPPPPVNANPTKQLVTRDDIQTDKRSQIEKDFDLRQKEFTSAMSIPVPPVPKFNDEMDLPIGQMEEAIRLITEQRKYDTDQFNKGYTNSANDDDWLKPKETSVKNEKFQTPPPIPIQSQPSIKYIKIDTADIDDNKNYVIDLLELEKPQTNISPKHISWSDEQPEQLNASLFKKLKRVEVNTNEQEIDLLKKNLELLNSKMETMNQNLNNILEILSKK
jgi:hypothetical protein